MCQILEYCNKIVTDFNYWIAKLFWYFLIYFCCLENFVSIYVFLLCIYFQINPIKLSFNFVQCSGLSIRTFWANMFSCRVPQSTVSRIDEKKSTCRLFFNIWLKDSIELLSYYILFIIIIKNIRFINLTHYSEYYIISLPSSQVDQYDLHVSKIQRVTFTKKYKTFIIINN